MNKKVFLAGGGGFLGLALAKKLAKKGYQVTIFDKRTKINLKNIKFIHGDITNYNPLINSLKGYDIVFNLASLLPCSRAGNMFWKVNVGGTENLLKACLKNKIKKIIHVSSSVVYGSLKEKYPDEKITPHPIGDYGKSKLAAEKICLKYFNKLKITIIRPRFIIGPGRLGLLTILFDWIIKNKNIYLIGSGKNHFQMASIEDLVNACILSIDKGDGEIFNIGEDNVPEVYEAMKYLITHAKSKSKIVPINAFIVQKILAFLNLFKLTPLNIEHYLVADKNYVLNTSKAKKILKWTPKQGQKTAMNQAFDYYLKNKNKLSEEVKSDQPKEGLLKLVKLFS